MKHIIKTMLLPLLALPFALLSCEEDRDSNPTINVAQASQGFVLNMPGNAANNTYDLVNAESLHLTCSQPDYGGVPYVTRYEVQVALAADGFDNAATYKTLNSTFTDAANINVVASELNDTVVALFQEANPDLAFTSTPRIVYLRLHAFIDGMSNMEAGQYTGESFSNVISLPSVLATYVAPPAKLPTGIFVVGSDIQTAWNSWKPLAPVYGLQGEFFTIIYASAGSEFKWGLSEGDWRGFDRIKNIEDNASAGVHEANGSGDENIVIDNAGWYVLHFTCDIVDNAQQYTLKVEPGKAFVIGAGADDNWTDSDSAWEMTAPADKSGKWESPAFAKAGELRAYVKVPGFDWWRTEYTLYNSQIYWRLVDIPDNWAANVGAEYSVRVEIGQKLYVDFDNMSGEVR